ncbi:trace amine-associated receptor 13c-like [Corythoichthys intestinalis]|uniref:trace amine-associated receptor 13c-like n=1 Tax=Corythoichthys intestinalis TaxID=161448 RepID=UPI0025A66317|nr:trace amine-associated receptor 13c-like [Corythoichthys intestinalis]
MGSEYQSDLCFPQLGNISCRKPTSDGSLSFFPRVFLSVACVLTVLLNLLIIISISHFRHMFFCSDPRIGQLYTPTNLLLLSLAISDVLVGLAGMPLLIIMSTSCWYFGHMACILWNYLTFICQSASVGNMVLISADRFAAICNPLHYPVQVTVKKIQLCVCLCWSASVIYCAITFKDNLADPELYTACIGECVIGFGMIGGILDIIVNFLLPLSIIVTLNMRVFVVVVHQAKAMRSLNKCVQHSAPSRAKKSELKAANTLGVLVLVFLLCFCPFYIVPLLAIKYEKMRSAVKYVYYLYNLNSCVNPLIYATFYPWFRRAIKHIVTLQILQPGSCDTNILKTKRDHI